MAVVCRHVNCAKATCGPDTDLAEKAAEMCESPDARESLCRRRLMSQVIGAGTPRRLTHDLPSDQTAGGAVITPDADVVHLSFFTAGAGRWPSRRTRRRDPERSEERRVGKECR